MYGMNTGNAIALSSLIFEIYSLHLA